MAFRLLHTADWHLGRKLEGRSRHREQEQVMEEICRIVEEERIDAVLMAGDVYDAFNPPADSESLFYETVARLSDGGRRGIVIIAGNHDSPDRLMASDPYGRALGVVTVGYPKDIPRRFDTGTGKVACPETAESFVRLRLGNGETLGVLALPYPSEARLREVLSERIDDGEAGTHYNNRLRDFMARQGGMFREGEPGIVMSHVFVREGKPSESEREIQVGGAYSVDLSAFPSAARYVALGHLHRPQEFVRENGPVVRYAGSPLQYSFSEAEQEKSVTIIEIDGEHTAHSTIPLSSGRPLINRKDLRGADELNRFLEAADPQAWISFAVTLEEALPVGYLESLNRRHPGILKPLFLYRRTDEEGMELAPISALSREEQFREFVRHGGEEPDREIIDLFLKLIADEKT